MFNRRKFDILVWLKFIVVFFISIVLFIFLKPYSVYAQIEAGFVTSATAAYFQGYDETTTVFGGHSVYVYKNTSINTSCYAKWCNGVIYNGKKYDLVIYPYKDSCRAMLDRNGTNHPVFVTDSQNASSTPNFACFSIKVCEPRSGSTVGPVFSGIKALAVTLTDLDKTSPWEPETYKLQAGSFVEIEHGNAVDKKTNDGGFVVYSGTGAAVNNNKKYSVSGYIMNPNGFIIKYGSKKGAYASHFKYTGEVFSWGELEVNPNGGTWMGSSDVRTFIGSPGERYSVSDPTPPSGKQFDYWYFSGGGSWSKPYYTYAATQKGYLKAIYKGGGVTPTPTGGGGGGITRTPTQPPPPDPEPVHVPVISTSETVGNTTYYYYYLYYDSNGGSGYISPSSNWYMSQTLHTENIYIDGVWAGSRSWYEYSYNTPTVTVKYNSFTPPYGYHRAGGWSSYSGYRPSSGYWNWDITPEPYNSLFLSEYQSYTLSGNRTVYARWAPNRHTIYYNQNHTAASVYDTSGRSSGSTSQRYAPLYFDQRYHVGSSPYYATRTGWTFVGWSRSRYDTVGLSDPQYWRSDSDLTLYAIFKRSFTVVLANDIVEQKSSQSFSKTIYTHDPSFNFNDSSFTSATRRNKGTYYVDFMQNGSSRVIGYGTYYLPGDGRVASTDVSNNTITATRYFIGWYDQETSGYQADIYGTKFGTSGTYITSTPIEYTPHDYNIKGNSGGRNMYLSSDRVTIYPIYTKTYIKLPDARRNEGYGNNPEHGGHEVDGNQEDKFIGWFSKPQPSNGTSGNGGYFYGTAGDVIELTDYMVDSSTHRVKMYPWFNIAPTIVESTLGQDLHNGVGDGFFEGQEISYDQLLALIDSKDIDNPAEIKPAGLITWSTASRWTDIFAINYMLYLNELNNMYSWNLTEADKKEIIANTMNQPNKNNFWPKITGITYYQNGLDSNGQKYPEGVADSPHTQDGSNVRTRGLITTKENVGQIVIHYQITDNGTFTNGVKIMKGITNPYGVPSGTTGVQPKFDVDSPITVNFDLITNINFNYVPRLNLKSTYMYTGDETITYKNITKWLWEKQDAVDREDDVDKKPWWYKSVTSVNLDDSIKIIGVYDIHFSSVFETDPANADICETIRNIKNIEELFQYKEDNYEVFKHITDFKVEWDCVDQWGKTASGYMFPGFDYKSNPNLNIPNVIGWKPGDDRPLLPGNQIKYGMTKEERTITVIMFNNDDDYDLLHGNASVSERMRYIDPSWVDYLSENSYWGDATSVGGKSNLDAVFRVYEERTGGTEYTGVYNNDGNQINVEVVDYTK